MNNYSGSIIYSREKRGETVNMSYNCKHVPRTWKCVNDKAKTLMDKSKTSALRFGFDRLPWNDKCSRHSSTSICQYTCMWFGVCYTADKSTFHNTVDRSRFSWSQILCKIMSCLWQGPTSSSGVNHNMIRFRKVHNT